MTVFAAACWRPHDAEATHAHRGGRGRSQGPLRPAAVDTFNYIEHGEHHVETCNRQP